MTHKLEIRIPQMGEGLQEARLLRFLKAPGDDVRQDEPIFEMETDKAILEIEAPVAGTVAEWSVEEDTVLSIGSVIGFLAVAEEHASPEATSPATDGPANVETPSGAGPAVRNQAIPPRTRAYARSLGLDDSALAEIASQVEGKLLPAHVDAYLAEQANAPTSPDYTDAPLVDSQRRLAYRLQRAGASVIAASEEITIDWAPLEEAAYDLRHARGSGARVSTTPFIMFAWLLSRVAVKHPNFLSALVSDGTARRYHHLHLGLAVSMGEDELVMARVPDADTLGIGEFTDIAHSAIKSAQQGDDQAHEAMQISLTNLAGFGIRRAVPVVVSPAVATLFVGAPFADPRPHPEKGFEFVRSATVVLSFDHRIMNGVGAARFLRDIREACAHPLTD